MRISESLGEQPATTRTAGHFGAGKRGVWKGGSEGTGGPDEPPPPHATEAGESQLRVAGSPLAVRRPLLPAHRGSSTGKGSGCPDGQRSGHRLRQAPRRLARSGLPSGRRGRVSGGFPGGRRRRGRAVAGRLSPTADSGLVPGQPRRLAEAGSGCQDAARSAQPQAPICARVAPGPGPRAEPRGRPGAGRAPSPTPFTQRLPRVTRAESAAARRRLGRCTRFSEPASASPSPSRNCLLVSDKSRVSPPHPWNDMEIWLN